MIVCLLGYNELCILLKSLNKLFNKNNGSKIII